MIPQPLRTVPRPAPARQPSIWLLLAEKQGDNRQVETLERALKEQLGWSCERKNLRIREAWRTAKPPVHASLGHLDMGGCDRLEPPWPDIIITIGRRPSMAALWIRERSCGRTKVVLVGKPSSPLEDYDLVVASAEVVLPRLPNVVTIGLPLMEVEDRAMRAAAERWRPRLATLPRPLVAFLVGGPTWPYVFDRTVARRLGRAAQTIAEETGGTACMLTSRRTPPLVADRLAALDAPRTRFFRWAADAQDNPYQALLALADTFVVTADSVSMMVEVVKAGKPLQIFPLTIPPRAAMDCARRAMLRWLFRPSNNDTLRQRLANACYRAGLLSQSRDLRALPSRLIEDGHAAPFGRTAKPARRELRDEVGVVVERLCALAPARQVEDR